MSEMQQLPRKRYYRVSEVCNYTDTQPYVLSFWESEFPQLKPEKSRSGQSMYRRNEIDVILRIKELLYDEEFSISEARDRLNKEIDSKGGVQAKAPAETSSAVRAAQAKQAPEPEEAAPPVEPPKPLRRARPVRAEAPPQAPVAEAAPEAMGSVPRGRYEDAVDEIAHLRLQLQEAETRLRKSESATDAKDGELEVHRQRRDRMTARMERLMELLS